MNEEGLTVEEAVEMMEYEGMGQDFLKAGIEDVERVERFGIARENDGLGFSRYGNKGPKKPGPPLSVRAAKEKTIGAKGPQKTAAEAPTLKENPDDVAINERANITRENEGKTPQFTEEELQRISRGEAHVDGGKVVDGPPPKDAGPEEGAKAGDLDGTSEGDQIDNLESSSTELPDDGKKTDTKPKGDEGKPDSTQEGNDGNDGNNQDGNNGDKVETDDTNLPWWRDNIVTRNPGRIATGAAVLGGGALLLGGTKTVNAPPDGSMRPAGDGSGGATPSEVPPGMAPNGGFEKDENGVLTDAGLEALLERSRRRIRSRPSINTGTQTMGNWIR